MRTRATAAAPGRSVRAAAYAVLALLLPAATAAAAEFERRVPAESGGRLRVQLDAGSVEVEGHDEPEVRVEAVSSGLANAMRFTLEGGGGDIQLRGRRRGVMGWLSGPRVRVHIRVPEAFSLDIRTGGGEVEVEGIQGEISARTSGGEVSAREIEGPVELRTSGGGVRVEEVRGDVSAHTSGGTVEISEVAGRVEAETSGGRMEIHDVTGPVDVRTSGGSISVRFSAAPAGEIRTSGGGIEVEFPEGSGLRIDARTSGGGIDLDPLVSLRGKVDRDRVEGDVNGGGESLSVRTSGGPIRIRAR
jgi:hypothetical protein